MSIARFVGDGASSRLVTVGSDSRLKLFDPESGAMQQQFVEKDQFMANYSCLAYSGSGNTFCALGSHQGTITIWDLKRGVVVRKIGGGQNEQLPAITDVCFNSNGTLLYSSSSSDKHVLEWNAQTGKMLRKLRCDKHGINKLCLSDDDASIACANSTVKVLDLSSGRKQKFVGGHSTVVTALVFCRGGAFLASSAKDCRFINIFDCSDKERRSPVRTLTLGDTPVSLSVAPPHADSSLICFAAVLESGAACIAAASPEEADEEAQITNISLFGDDHDVDNGEEGDDTPAVLSACFHGDHLQIAHGPSSKPNFGRMPFRDENGELLSDVAPVTANGGVNGSGPLVMSARTMNGDAGQHSRSQAHIGSGSAAELGGRRERAEDDSDTAPSKRRRVGGDNEQSLGQRVAALAADLREEDRDDEGQEEEGGEEDSEEEVDGRAKSAHKLLNGGLTSLKSVLEQALKSGDEAQLNYCLNVEDAAIINSTVTGLSLHSVVILVQKVVDKFERRPMRAENLIVWLRAILSKHMSLLVSNRDVVSSIQGLVRTVEHRCAPHKKLLKLSGRLDLLLDQTAGAGAGASVEDPAVIAASVVDEESLL